MLLRLPRIDMLPEEYIKILPKEKEDEVVVWWNSLCGSIQQELVNFFEHGEKDIIAMAQKVNHELHENVIVELEADHIRDLEAYEFPNQDWYENLIGHDVYLCFRGPTFHICKAHKKLRLYLLLGLLPTVFRCFINNKMCIMEKELVSITQGYLKLNVRR